jgi:signal transduction histidine kinase
MAETEQLIRETGIDALGSVLWGTHFCLFYRTKQDLLNILVPYFKAGLENNEFCMWITSDPLDPTQAKNAMKEAMPDFDKYLRKGQIEILPYDQWYLEADDFNQQRTLKKWNDKLTGALTNGYAGMRVTGNTTWIDQKVWTNFVDYEHTLNEMIDRWRIIAVCTYCLDSCGPAEIVQVVNTHQLALIERAHQWELIKNAERIRAEKRARQYQAHLKSLASELSLAEERERHQIATALHDKISQSLVISKIKLEALRKSGFGLDLDKAIEDICNSLGRVIQDTRTLTFDLSNPVLYELGFETAVAEWLTNEIQAKYSISTEFEDDGQDKPLNDNIRVFLFRDVRELLINVVKHAHAKNLKVSIKKMGNAISVSVQDDGVGFDPAEVTARAAKKGEFGLFSIREHLEQSGGCLEIESAPGQGCKVTMTAPLKTDGDKK